MPVSMTAGMSCVLCTPGRAYVITTSRSCPSRCRRHSTWTTTTRFISTKSGYAKSQHQHQTENPSHDLSSMSYYWNRLHTMRSLVAKEGIEPSPIQTVHYDTGSFQPVVLLLLPMSYFALIYSVFFISLLLSITSVDESVSQVMCLFQTFVILFIWTIAVSNLWSRDSRFIFNGCFELFWLRS